jgi:hypothetical protein
MYHGHRKHLSRRRNMCRCYETHISLYNSIKLVKCIVISHSPSLPLFCRLLSSTSHLSGLCHGGRVRLLVCYFNSLLNPISCCEWYKDRLSVFAYAMEIQSTKKGINLPSGKMERYTLGGSNNFGQTGISKSAGQSDATVIYPTEVPSLGKEAKITTVFGGKDHSLALVDQLGPMLDLGAHR